MANIFGRQVIVLLTNKSGGSVVAGDVVIVDTGNDAAFTTTTSGGFTGGIGVAQEVIANNATGRVLTAGYAALVNVNASVTRGQYGKTHTVAKQATGTASRGVGTFCQWLTGGTTPTALVYSADLNASAGNVATDPIWDAAGDLAVGSGADTAAKLSIGAAGGRLSRINGAVAWNSGTSFPTAATGDIYHRTDILPAEWRYDGTRWRSVAVFSETGVNDTAGALSANGTAGRWNIPGGVTFSDIWIVAVVAQTFHSGSPMSTKFWTGSCLKGTAAESETEIGSFDTHLDTSDNWTTHTMTVGALLTSGTNNHLRISMTKTSTPGNVLVISKIIYQLVTT